MSGKIKFEAALKKIEEIVREFENEEMTLDELTEKYEEGMKLISLCNDELSKAENKIEMLVDAKKGKKSRVRFKDIKETRNTRQNTPLKPEKNTPAEDMKGLNG
ncbi:exodeoxyribonuclease VII small subunit [bacterium]|jgi:exodeoxyribonuclease VII small subunit|nr:exodeoxyribonuclease VII small subunit [bacterium]